MTMHTFLSGHRVLQDDLFDLLDVDAAVSLGVEIYAHWQERNRMKEVFRKIDIYFPQPQAAKIRKEIRCKMTVNIL